MGTKLRTARVGRGYSQDELASLLRTQFGIPTASKRMIRRWESEGVTPGPAYAMAVSAALGMTPEELGLPSVIPDELGRHVRAIAPFTVPDDEGLVSDGRLPGIWLSRYQYYSTGRRALYVSQHYAIVVHNGPSVTVESLPLGVVPRMTLELTVEGSILTGTWQEWTNPDGHYLGERRWGALQLILNPARRYMLGKWVGWGSNGSMNSGPWELRWVSADDMSTESLAPFNRPLPDEPVT